MDFTDSMAKVSGLSKERIREIWEEVKANKKLMDNCAGPHDFSEMSTSGGMMRTQFRCAKCGGVVNGAYRRAYEEGLAHGRASIRIEHP